MINGRERMSKGKDRGMRKQMKYSYKETGKWSRLKQGAPDCVKRVTKAPGELMVVESCLWLGVIPALIQSLDFTYHNSQELENYLKNLSTSYPAITYLHSIGKSVEGRDLWVFVVGKFPTRHRIGIPEFKYVANMHGDEVVGRELMLHLIEHLVTNYQSDPEITQMIDKTRIHIMPTMNPDGFEASSPHCSFSNGRYNKNGCDLNRNFPDAFEINSSPIQPETQAVMNWILSETFILSANLHGGAVVASYPYDNSDVAAPDNDVFIHLAKLYSKKHANMYKGNACSGTSFQDGITNGYSWYPVQGGMQDFNYIYGQCFEITIEVSCCKYPQDTTLSGFWNDNKVSLIEYMKQVHMGIKGQVFDMNGNPIPDAIVEVQGWKHICPYKTNQNGEYYLLLLPGNYTFNVTAVPNQSIIRTIYIPESQNYSAMKYDFNYTVPVSSGMPITTTCNVTPMTPGGNNGSTLKAFTLSYILSTALLLLILSK
ncbi:carboxypeptidase M [Rhinophrynus dorsalis]